MQWPVSRTIVVTQSYIVSREVVKQVGVSKASGESVSMGESSGQRGEAASRSGVELCGKVAEPRVGGRWKTSLMSRIGPTYSMSILSFGMDRW